MSVQIDDLPVPLDFKFQIRNFLGDRLPPEEILFARCIDRRQVNPLTCGNEPDYFALPYPTLPPISIGEYQCPTGFSRYGRALFLVDWFVLGKVAKKCWGWANENAPADIPSDWVTGSPNAYSVSLKFGGQESLIYHVAQMFPLTPYRVPGLGSNLWLLPLVDRRYFMRQVHESVDEEPASWTSFFSSLATELGISAVFTNNFLDSANAYRKPDVRLYRTEVPQESAVLMDTAALSVGLRPIYDAVANKFILQDASNATQTRIKRTADPRIIAPDANSPTSPLLISGGRRGSGVYPEAVKLWVKKDGNFVSKTVNIPGGGIKFTTPPIWTSFESNVQGEIDAFANRVAQDLQNWSDSGGQYCFAGVVVKAVESQLISSICGFDDYMSIKIAESLTDGQQLLTTRFYEMPAMFTPPVILVGGKSTGCSGSSLKYCVLAEDATSCPVWAFRATMADDGSVTVAEPSELFELYFHSDLLSSPKVARAGYKCMYSIDDQGRDSFLGNPCINSCQGVGALNVTLPDGNVDSEYLDATIDGDSILPTDPPPGNGITVEGLPDGLTYDNETGEVTGTPTTEGTYLVTVMGTDTSGCALTDIVSVTIGPALEEEGGGPDPDPPVP